MESTPGLTRLQIFRRSLMALFIGGLAVWFVAMSIHYAYAGEKWKIVTTAHASNGESVKFTLGSNETGPRYFDSEKACKEAMKSDPGFLESKKKVDEFAAKSKVQFEPFTCVLELQTRPKNEI